MIVLYTSLTLLQPCPAPLTSKYIPTCVLCMYVFTFEQLTHETSGDFINCPSLFMAYILLNLLSVGTSFWGKKEAEILIIVFLAIE